MTDSDSLLLGVLALTDATWLPCRPIQGTARGNAHALRQSYAVLGVAWASQAATETARKAAQREIEALHTAGLVQTSRPKSVRTLGCRLTEAGEVRARGLAGLPSVFCGWLSLSVIAKRSTRPPRLLADVWVEERTLCRDPASAGGPELVTVENLALPALVRGWIASNADADGRVCYAVTPAGWARLARTAPVEEEEEGPEADPEAIASYDSRLASALARRDQGEALRPAEIGELPLPVSREGIEAAGPWVDPAWLAATTPQPQGRSRGKDAR